MVRKTRAEKTHTPSTPVFQSDRFRSIKNREIYEKLNIFRLIWADSKVILDEVDLEICRNFKRRGWLPLLEVELAALIKDVYSNPSVHFDDSNIQFMKS